LKELLSKSRNKSQLTELLAEALLNEFKDSDQDLVVSYENLVKSNNADFLPDDIKIHTHEEADTMIPLQVLDAVKESKVKAINVWSPSTDVLILVIDVAARGHLGEFTTLRLLTGREAKYWAIDVQERVSIIGTEKSKELIVFHHFTCSN